VAEADVATLAEDDEAGFVGGLWGWIFGLLIFVAGTLLVARTWAARQAARTYVQAPNGIEAGSQAEQAADAALGGYGRNPSAASVALVSGTFSRCSLITIKVSYPAPMLVLPWLGPVGHGGRVSAVNSELVDPFRTGLPGTSSCA
jgi:hypothetical protein